MHLLRAKPPAEAIKEAGVTIEEFQHFQSMIMKSQAAAVVAANVSNRQINVSRSHQISKYLKLIKILYHK